MKTVLHKAATRGHQDHGWLKANHTFSFANYYDPERVHFGALRVLNDDHVEGGMGFGMHPHANMEIITIPLSGELHHKDSMGNFGAIQKGEIQVMSAGTGVQHSEFNGRQDEAVKLLQIWVIPNKMGVQPRYDQIKIADSAKPNDFQQIVSPNSDDEGSWIHQDAWFNLANFDKGTAKEYQLKMEGNGVYVFMISGKAKVGEVELSERDGLGISETDRFIVEALENAEILLMEVPMNLPRM
ncbi:pirin family protein [Chryseobacterium taklimakanense]|uniref:pirin family protein n=1 Tax=Chryseobacterium taklimakanense TaxID=536441 RepID=UPI0023F8A0EE|nr:pirin family protein [Chryseobacterium taklimakanense]